MRAVMIGLGLVLTGCGTLPASQDAPTAGNAPQSATQAYFTQYPDDLFFVAGDLCDGPGQTAVSPNRNQVRCESLPDPESAAALILEFNGSVQDLPRFVTSFSGRDTDQGYLVTMDNYIYVPQRDGGARQIRFPNEEVRTDFAKFLTKAGGRPL